MDTPVDKNKPLQFAETFISSATALAKQVLKMALTAIPNVGFIFKLPVVSQIVDILINKYGDLLGDAIRINVDFIIIDHQTFEQGQEARVALEDLRAHVTDERVLAAFDEKYRKLIRLRG